MLVWLWYDGVVLALLALAPKAGGGAALGSRWSPGVAARSDRER